MKSMMWTLTLVGAAVTAGLVVWTFLAGMP